MEGGAEERQAARTEERVAAAAKLAAAAADLPKGLHQTHTIQLVWARIKR